MKRLKSIPLWISCILLTANLVVYGQQERQENTPPTAVDNGQFAAADLEEYTPQQSTGSNAVAGFNRIESSGNLQDRISRARNEAADLRLATRYWLAYGFDVIPGVAVDMEVINTDGSTNTFTMMSGGFETRRLGLFSLYEPDSDQVIRIETYNLDRRRNYNGYPVYWLGDVAPDQGAAYLAGLLAADENGMLGDRVVMGLALHDDPAAARELRRIVQSDMSSDRRASAVSWLGHRGETPAFFSDIAEDEEETGRIRKNAISALARRGDIETMKLLQSLYGKIKDREIKKRIISAMTYDRFGDEVGAFLLKTAQDSGEDREVRKQAINRLSHTGNATYGNGLIAMFDRETDRDIRSRLLNAIAHMDTPAAREKILDIARNAPNSDQRKRAIRSLDRHDEDTATLIAALYDNETSIDVQATILDILGESHHAAATAKLIEITRSTASEKLRKKATYWLGKSEDPQALRFFEDMFKN